MSEILFFKSSITAQDPALSAEAANQKGPSWTIEVWTPTWNRIKPSGFPFLPWAIWSLFHWMGIFGNDRYRIFLVRGNGGVVHRSCIFPRYFRFPFMRLDDVQVGDIWTAEAMRGRGMAASVLRQIVAEFPTRQVWFLCESSNESSARLARSAGMVLYGIGKRRSKFGISALGQFEIDRVVGA